MKITISSLWQMTKRNVWLKVLAVLMAILLWTVVVGHYNPETTRTLSNIPIQVITTDSIPEAEGLMLVTDLEKQTVDVRVEARRDILALLNYDKITAKVDLSTVNKAGTYSELPVRIDFGGQNVTLVSQSISTVSLQFDNSKTAQIKVDVEAIGKVADGFVLGRSASPGVINVEGPESVVSKIAGAKCTVKQDEFVETAKYTCDYIFVDESGAPVQHSALKADYDQIEVTISVNIEKTVPLQVEIINSSGGNDADFITAKVVPETIKISGNAEALAEINSITIGSLDVSAIRGDYNESMNIILPNGLRNVDGVEQATVSLSFPNTVTKSFRITKFRMENLPQGTSAKIVERAITVRVRGVAADIDKLRADQLTLVVDCQKQTLATGNNSVAAYVSFPQGVKVGTIGAYEATVRVS